MKAPVLASLLVAATVALRAQDGVDSKLLIKPLGGDAWPTYGGDYSGRRFSSLTQIDQSNVKNLTLAWTRRLSSAANVPAARTGGVGDVTWNGATTMKGSILQVDGILYMTMPDNVWAVDARDGRELWHYVWKTRGGTHIGNRGAGMWRNYLFFVTPDDFFVSLDARTGKQRWAKEIASFDQQYFHTTAPIVIDNRVLVGSGDDLDMPGFLQSFDPESGDLQWKWYATPQKPGDPGLDTWKNLDAAIHGGGQPWVPGSYDPDTRLYIFGTGNPTPAYFSAPRGEGLDNLFTCSLVAVDVDTGKMRWYYQTSPHDTHDWDSAQTPVLVDGLFNGRPRKMAMTAARNGYFFVVDRVTGEHLLTSKFSDTANWAMPELNAKGQPVRIPAKDHHVGGALVSLSNGGATNWPPPAFSPKTGLFYVSNKDNYAMYYLTELDPRGALGLAGKDEQFVSAAGSFLKAIDYTTGKIAWRHEFRTLTGGGSAGLLVTASDLLFAGDGSGNLIAFDAAKGTPLWHANIGAGPSNAPETYLLDGKQYVLVAAGDTLFAFYLY